MQGVGSKIALQKVAANKNKLDALFSVGKDHNQSLKSQWSLDFGLCSRAAPVALFQRAESGEWGRHSITAGSDVHSLKEAEISAELVYGFKFLAASRESPRIPTN
jgi:hypothetical protein